MSWYLSYISNQREVPAMLSNTLANIPATALTGTLFIATDTFALYRYDGSTWQLIGGPGTGTITGSGTANQVAYFTASGVIASNANLLYNGTNLTVANDATISGIRVGNGSGAIATNTAIGQSVLASNTTGNENTAVGYFAMAQNSTGQANVAIGYNALVSATNTSLHIAIGNRALEFLNNNSTGSVAVGAQSLRNTTTGGGNTAVGNYTGINITTGSFNTFFGQDAGYNVTTGNFNHLSGHTAAYRLTTGSYNICIGYQSGGQLLVSGLATGSENIFIGANTLPASTSASNQIVIGYGAASNGADTVTIGNNSILNTYLKGTVNATHISVTKNVSGTGIEITDSANGNALSISKSGSGNAINVSTGTTALLFTQIGATDGESLLVFNNSATFTTATIRNNGSGIIAKFANNTTNILTVRNNSVLINTDTDDTINKLQINGGLLSQFLTVNQNTLGGVAATIRNTVTAISGVTGYGVAIESEASAATSYAFTIRNLTGSQTYLHVLTQAGSVGYIGINKTNPTEFLDVAGNIKNSGSYFSGNPSGGTAQPWKLGSYVAVAAPAPTGYIEIDINGTLYKVAAGT